MLQTQWDNGILVISISAPHRLGRCYIHPTQEEDIQFSNVLGSVNTIEGITTVLVFPQKYKNELLMVDG
jgi:hypothetical protein